MKKIVSTIVCGLVCLSVPCQGFGWERWHLRLGIVPAEVAFTSKGEPGLGEVTIANPSITLGLDYDRAGSGVGVEYFDQDSRIGSVAEDGEIEGVNLSLVRSPPGSVFRWKLKAGYVWGSLQLYYGFTNGGPPMFNDTHASGWQIGGEVDLIRRPKGRRGIWVPLTVEILYRSLTFQRESGSGENIDTVDASGVVIRLGFAWEH